MRTLALALLVFGVTAESSAQEPAAPAHYWTSVLQYALETFSLVSDRDIATAIRSAHDLANKGRPCPACEARERFDGLPIRAAILLHSEVERAEGARATTHAGQPDCTKGRHAAAVEKLLELVAHQKGGKAFLVDFHTVQALYQRSVLCLFQAQQWADAGLKFDAKAPLLLLAAGLADESTGAFSGMFEMAASDPESQGQDVRAAGGVDRNRLITRAAERYSKALIANPELVEAHLRLGRLRHRQGKVDEARKSLRQAISLASGPLLYLAHLFLGQSFEAGGDLEAAVQEYRLALVLEPGMQTASVALAHALVRQGKIGQGREILDRALSDPGDRRLDTYWFYFVGNKEVGEALFERLRGAPR